MEVKDNHNGVIFLYFFHFVPGLKLLQDRYKNEGHLTPAVLKTANYIFIWKLQHKP